MTDDYDSPWKDVLDAYFPNFIEFEASMGNPYVTSVERQGIQKGEATILRRQLQHRFGPLPDWVTQRLAQALPEQMQAWAEHLLDADTLEAVFGKD